MHKRLLFLLVLCRFSTVYAAEVILNEYNAVGGTKQLDAGAGADSFFGTVDGNGGNWFELLVIEDHVDMRGWKFDWTEAEVVGENDETAAGQIALSTDDFWSDLRSGSIVTFIESINGEGEFNTATDTSYDPLNNDWWINISTQGEAAKATNPFATTTTNDGVAGDFSVGKDDWTLTILKADNSVVFGPVGEGAEGWAGDSVSSEEGAGLEGPVATAETPVTLETWQAIAPDNGFYDDTGSTSFGAANADYDDIDKTFITIQDLSILRTQVGGTPIKSGDFDGDGTLTVADINALTAAVSDPNADEKFDLNSDSAVNAEDRRLWIEVSRNSYFGDSNLDGEFGSADLVFVFQANQYEDATPKNSKWETGDWNGDGDFSTADFVFAFQAAGYEVGPRVAQAVPEPSALMLTSSIAICLLGRRRR